MIPQIVDERLGLHEGKKTIISLSPNDSDSILIAMLLSRLDPALKHPQAICIVPHPESAIQIMDLLLKMQNRITCVLGLPPSLKDYVPLVKKVPVEEQVIVGTPVTIHKWIVSRKLVLEGPGLLLFDDVDQLLAVPGFEDEVMRIIKAIGMSKRSPPCQVIMCSSIWSDAVEVFVSKTKQLLSRNEYAKGKGQCLDNSKQYQESLSKIQVMIMRTPHDKNIIAISPFGSGKLTSLVSAILCRVERKLKHAQTIWIVPDRELATQIQELLVKMGKQNPITCVLGLPPSLKDYTPLVKKLPVEAQVIVGTPLTIHKWIVSRKLVLEGVGLLLVDDVDQLLAVPGFEDGVLMIMKAIGMSKRSPQCQVLMCSSISSNNVEAFVTKTKGILSKNEYVSVNSETEVPCLDDVKHYMVMVPDEHSKLDIVLYKILELKAEDAQTIIIVDTIESSSMLLETLKANKFNSKIVDCDDPKEQRDQALKEFKENRCQILISTEILDWVFDQSQVGLVIIFDLSSISGPSPEQQYSRCIGREGHRKGAVFSLICSDVDRTLMEKIKIHNNVTEVLRTSDQQFVDALMKAGL